MVNAIANATGIRFRTLPLTPDRLFPDLVALSGTEETLLVTA